MRNKIINLKVTRSCSRSLSLSVNEPLDEDDAARKLQCKANSLAKQFTCRIGIQYGSLYVGLYPK